jgi:hypothetical protein
MQSRKYVLYYLNYPYYLTGKETEMNVEQIARNFMTEMIYSPEKAKALITADAMESGGMLPQAMPLVEGLKSPSPLMTAFPDGKVEIDSIKVDGNQATVSVHLNGTQTGPFSFGVPGVPDLPPTGKKAGMKDRFVVTVQGDKVSNVLIDSPADGGLPALLAQLGYKMPGM